VDVPDADTYNRVQTRERLTQLRALHIPGSTPNPTCQQEARHPLAGRGRIEHLLALVDRRIDHIGAHTAEPEIDEADDQAKGLGG
jgi:hypothetical protein